MSIMRFDIGRGATGGTNFSPAPVYVPPKAAPPPKKTPPKKPSTGTAKKSSSSGGGSSGSSGGIKKSSDKAQVAALEKLLSEGFAKARDQRIANIQTAHGQGDQILLKATILG